VEAIRTGELSAGQGTGDGREAAAVPARPIQVVEVIPTGIDLAKLFICQKIVIFESIPNSSAGSA